MHEPGLLVCHQLRRSAGDAPDGHGEQAYAVWSEPGNEICDSPLCSPKPGGMGPLVADTPPLGQLTQNFLVRGAPPFPRWHGRSGRGSPGNWQKRLPLCECTSSQSGRRPSASPVG